MTRTITIPKDKLPTKLYSVTIKAPNYGDYRNARKRYPVPRFENDPAANTPYSVEELLFAMCLEAINNEPLDRNPKDMIERLNPFPIQDRQYLMALFTGLFYISRSQAQSARDLAEQQSKVYAQTHAFAKEVFPNREHSVSFYTPNSAAQMQADSKFQAAGQVYAGYSVNLGCSFEDYLSAFCLHTVDGEPFEQPKDVISTYDSWSICDVQFLSLLFTNLFTIDESTREDAKKYAEELKLLFTDDSVAAETQTTTRKGHRNTPE